MTFTIIKPKMYISLLCFSSIGPILGVFFLFWIPDSGVLNWGFAIAMFAVFFLLLFILVLSRIKVTENGVFIHRIPLKSEFKSWDDIIFINVNWYPWRNNRNPLYIEFYEEHEWDLSEVYAKSALFIKRHTDLEAAEAIERIEKNYPNNRAFLRVHYRKKIITEISKYYHGEILGLQRADMK